MKGIKKLKRIRKFYEWTTSIPLIATGLYFSGYLDDNIPFQIFAGILLVFSVMSAVHHSEIVAHRVGEPYGTIILALSITVIEVSIIVSLMITGGEQYAAFARDTVYAAVMLILNGIVGLSLFIGGNKFHTQTFSAHSVRIALVTLISIVAFTMILPSFTNSQAGPYYNKAQLIFEVFACIVIYVAFISAQTTKHREYFIISDDNNTASKSDDMDNYIAKEINKNDNLNDDTNSVDKEIENSNREVEIRENEKNPVSVKSFIISLIFLILSLTIVVLLAKDLSHPMETVIVYYGLPKSLVGVIIAAIILLPEGIAAVNAARKDRLQTSLNLALGSAIASIGLTIPVVSIVSYFWGFPLILGLDLLSIILLVISIFTVMISLIGGRSNSVYGVVLLVNLMAYVFLTINP